MNSAIDDARAQLEQRFQLVSGVARLGFNTSVMCFGKIYVPELPLDAVTQFGPADDDPPFQWGKGPKGTQKVSSSDGSQGTQQVPSPDGSQEPDAPPDLTPYTVIEVLTTTMEYQRKGLR